MLAKEEISYELFENLYRGLDERIHEYKEFRNDTEVTCVLNTMMLPKTIGEDWSSVIVGEGLEILINEANEEVEYLINDMFIPLLSDFIEKVMVIGQGMIIPIRNDDNVVCFNFYIGSEFEVEDFVNNKPTKVLLHNELYDITITYDFKTNTSYYEHELTCEEDEVPEGFELPDDYELKGEINYFKPNITNNITFGNEGLSVLANALDLLQDVDTLFTDKRMEFMLSKKRIFISNALVRNTEAIDSNTGEFVTEQTFNPNDPIYTFINGDDSNDIKEYGGVIRFEAYDSAIKDSVKRVGDSAGLKDYYTSYGANGSQAKNEEQIISENSKLYRNRVKHINLFMKQLLIVVNNILELYSDEDEYTLKTSEDIKIKFDDSVIIDEGKEYDRDVAQVENNLMSPKAFLIKHRGFKEDSDELKQELELISDVQDPMYDE